MGLLWFERHAGRQPVRAACSVSGRSLSNAAATGRQRAGAAPFSYLWFVLAVVAGAVGVIAKQIAG